MVPPYRYHGAPRWIADPSILVSSSLPITFHQEFLKGKPLILGICLIVAAVIQILLGIWLFCIFFILFSVMSGIVFWAPIFYIITGSLMIAGAGKPSVCLVNSSMILNILDSVFSFIALVLVCLDLTFYYYFNGPFRSIPTFYLNAYFPLSLVLISDLLFLSISITSAVFAGRAMRHVPSIPQCCSHSTAARSIPAFQIQGAEMVSSAPPGPAPQQMMPQMGRYGTQNQSMA